MRVAGADLSSYGVHLFALNPVATAHYEVNAVERKDRRYTCATLSAEVKGWVEHEGIEALFIEEPVVAGARNLRSSLLIAQVCGAILAGLPIRRSYLVPVSSWKKTVVGHGNASKSEVRDHLDAWYPALASYAGDSQDLYDALGIALHGQRLLRNVDEQCGRLLEEPRAS